MPGEAASASRYSASASSNAPADQTASACTVIASGLCGAMTRSACASRWASVNSPMRSADRTSPMRAGTLMVVSSDSAALR